MKSCTAKKHVFKDDDRKCLCGRADKWWSICGRCKVAGVAKYSFLLCDDCLNDPEYQKEIKVSNGKSVSTGRIRRYTEVVAFGHDKATGRPWALDKKGNRVDPERTRYNTERDPHGWGATGKIPKKKKYYI